MSFERALGGAAVVVLIATTFALATTQRSDTHVLGEGATVDPHLYAEQVSTIPGDASAVLADRLANTTTTEYQTTTTVVEEATTVVPEETASTAADSTSQSTTATTQAKSASPTTTAPPATTTTPPAPSGGYNSEYESSFTSKINSLRSSKGLGALSRHSSLDAEARAWSKHMAEEGGLSHSGIGRLIPPWSSVAENVGTGPGVTAIFNALASSSGHLDHMLGSYDYVGVGVWVDSHGVIWTTHIFAK